MRRSWLISLLFLLSTSALPTAAQNLAERLAATDYRLSHDETHAIGVDLHALAFFKNNEFSGPQATGYTLPGLWLQPRLFYQPLDALALRCYIKFTSGLISMPNFSFTSC